MKWNDFDTVFLDEQQNIFNQNSTIQTTYQAKQEAFDVSTLADVCKNLLYFSVS